MSDGNSPIPFHVRRPHSSQSRKSASQETAEPTSLRVATYNIHKGVRGVGLNKRLEIHNLGLGIEGLEADLVFLQEVRRFHQGDSMRFKRTVFGWPDQPQADFLAPQGYYVAYRTNAYTRDGEHGNALLSRWPIMEIGHHDVSDHRFEQRGLLHAQVQLKNKMLHAVVVHLGLIHASRLRQVHKLVNYIEQHIPAGDPLIVAGDFNDWSERLDQALSQANLIRAQKDALSKDLTYPSRMPLFALDRVYTRKLDCLATHVPRGSVWQRMSDHLPLMVELALNRN